MTRGSGMIVSTSCPVRPPLVPERRGKSPSALDRPSMVEVMPDAILGLLWAPRLEPAIVREENRIHSGLALTPMSWGTAGPTLPGLTVEIPPPSHAPGLVEPRRTLRPSSDRTFDVAGAENPGFPSWISGSPSSATCQTTVERRIQAATSQIPAFANASRLPDGRASRDECHALFRMSSTLPSRLGVTNQPHKLGPYATYRGSCPSPAGTTGSRSN